MGVIHHGALQDLDVLLTAEGLEIIEGAQVDIGRVVPLVCERRRHRHAAAQCQLQATLPVPEVWERHDALLTDAQHFVQQPGREMHRLQGLGHDHEIEGVGVEVGQPRVQVGLDDVDPGADAGHHVVRIDLQAISGRPASRLQVREQPAVAAAQVQHPAARSDPFGNDLQVGTQAHWPSVSAATRSMYAPKTSM